MLPNAVSFRTKLFVWLLIVTQFNFPLAATGTLNGSEVGSDNPFLKKPADTSLQTQVHILSSGENSALLAQKYHMTLEELRKLNQFRTFAHGFEHLQPGDELDVPLAPLPEIIWNDAAISKAAEQRDDGQLQKIASLASQMGDFLSNNPTGDTAANRARGTVNSVVSGKTQQWLNQFGTARVQLDTDKNFSLKNSQFDLLVPLYEQKDRLVFTQGSLHRTDDRTQSNIGVGFRHFSPGYMLGGNVFGDYDLSQEHARAGIGVEYWRDFLKLNANSYRRLTGWKDSPDVEDYEVRPANGWDVHAQAWLPSLPQLGVKLAYQQYYGKEVALFGKETRQHNPHTLTAGLDYTPVPLITFSAEQRQGQHGKSDTHLGVELHYQLGVPWHQQLNPEAVAAMRSLAGSRYDLVARNNNILLEYHQQQVIHLQTAEQVSGYTGEQKSLGVSVTSKYGLAHIEWTAPTLLASGGKIVQVGVDYSVVLPPYQKVGREINTYLLSGVAVDTRGNRTERSEIRVTVLAPVITESHAAQENSAITRDQDSYVAGREMMVTVTLKDAQGNPVSGQASALTNDRVQVAHATAKATAWKDAGNGIYTRTYTAQQVGTNLKARLQLNDWRGANSSPAYTIGAGAATQANSAITRDRDSYLADDEMMVTVTLKDAQGNPVSGQASALTNDSVQVAHATAKATAWTDAGNGTYTRTYTAQQAGSALKATLQLPDWNSADESAAYAISEPAAIKDISVNSYIFKPDEGFPTTGFEKATFTLELSNGNASDYIWASNASWISVRNGEVTFTGKATGDKVTITGTPKNGAGTEITYTFTLKEWYISNDGTKMTWSNAAAYCSNQTGYSQPTVEQLNGNASHDDGTRGTLGALWSEWGFISGYSGSDFVGLNHWTSEQASSGQHYYVSLGEGDVYRQSDTGTNYVVCRQRL
ncbi:inverse autotransporter beta domain-containing protein [Serratia symbiotica]|nr:inverse autotransporter beta domain-containing protein [Serratia symbiotica]